MSDYPTDPQSKFKSAVRKISKFVRDLSLTGWSIIKIVQWLRDNWPF
jgi:hypothetical protein